MKYCTKCGKQMYDEDVFCTGCGAQSIQAPQSVEHYDEQQTLNYSIPEYVQQPVYYSQPAYYYDPYQECIAKETEFLNSYSQSLKTEQKIWLIFGIIALVIGCINTFIYLLYLVLSYYNSNQMSDIILSIGQGLTYIASGIVAIVQSDSKRKVNSCIYEDIRPAAKKAGSFGNIILGIFFCTIGMIFAIINYSITKKNKEMIEVISARQQTDHSSLS